MFPVHFAKEKKNKEFVFPMLVTLAQMFCINLRKCARRLYRIGRESFSPQVERRRNFAVTPIFCRRVYRAQVKFARRQGAEAKDVTVGNEEVEDLDGDEIEEDESSAELQQFLSRSLYIREIGHQVFVVQPYVKWGPNKKKLTRPVLQLDEAVTLIKTLRNWKVVDKALISVDRLDKPRVFGRGQLENLKYQVDSNPKITAVFLSVNMLKPFQQDYLQGFLGVSVYDRYTIVMHIFRNHATTREAKLQIMLAELPYLWSRLKYIERGSLANFGDGNHGIGTTWKGREFHDQLLKRRQSKIREQIEKLRFHRQLSRKNRMKKEFPVIAVVGYTNSGKTSLIKALTGREQLQPQNYLFATLDVTTHEGYLPSSLKVFFVDTIGFISDIPTSLFESFVATLEDVCMADVIVHVRDVSHPDTVAQNQNVHDVLKILELPEKLSNNMITVGNKIDLLSNEDLSSFKNEDMVLISATEKIGTDVLRNKIEEYVLRATDRKIMIMRVKISGDEYNWLMENTTVISQNPDPENSEYMLVKVIITSVILAKFKHIFIKDYFKKR